MPHFTELPLQGAVDVGKSSPITDLPLELLAEIFNGLEWKDILIIRKTCKYLYIVSKARAIWLDLFHRASSSSSILEEKPPRLERPIEMYTSDELEYVFLQWKSAQIGWIVDDELPARERVISTVDAAVMHLVEGCRWLLVVDCYTAAISYYDLEASIIAGKSLTPPLFERSDVEPSVLLSVDMDHAGPTLAFNLALSVLGKISEAGADCSGVNFLAPTQAPKTMIWRVKLKLDNKNAGIALAARRVASFSHLPEVKSHYALSLRGPHVAFGSYCVWDAVREYCIVIVDWEKANDLGSGHSMRIIPRSNRPRSIRLLPHNRLLSVEKMQIRLYDYTSAPQSTSISEFSEAGAEFLMRPVWSVKTRNIIHWRASEAFNSSDTTRVTFHDSKALYDVTIAEDNSIVNLPVITKHLNLIPSRINENRWTTSQKSTAVTVYNQGLFLMRYSRPTDEDYQPTSTLWKRFGPQCTSGFGPLFDVNSGRIIIAGPTRDKQTILDLALLYK